MIVLASLMTISLAVMYTKNQSLLLNDRVKKIKLDETSQEARDSALNALARFKALVNESKDSASNSYIPGLYALDYFEFKAWKIKLKDSLKTKEASNHLVLVDNTIELNDQNWEHRIKIESIENDGWMAKAINASITSFRKGDPKKSYLVKARIGLSIPQPTEPKLYFRKANTTDDFVLLQDQILPDGRYEVQAYGSGIMRGARLVFDGKEFLLGLSASGDIQHQGISYDAKDVAIGNTQTIEIKDPVFDNAACSETALDNSHSIQLFLIDVEGKESVSTGLIRLSNPPRNLSIDDYKTQCINECPWFEASSNGQDALSLQEHAQLKDYMTRQSRLANPKDVSSSYTWEEAQRFHLTDKKLCVNPKGFAYNFFGSNWFTHSIPSCQREFLMTRTNCGCVASDSLILLGDSVTTKRIDRLDANDQIWNPILKRSMKIKRMTRGPEKKVMLKIFVGSHSLLVTDQHPFPTKRGMTPASQLKVGDQIMLEDASWLEISQIDSQSPQNELPIVWNIEVDAPTNQFDAHHYVANGITTGDLLIQMNLQNKANPRLVGSK